MMNKKHKLTSEVIEKLNAHFKIPSEKVFQDYYIAVVFYGKIIKRKKRA
jgi:hypothetical protein